MYSYVKVYIYLSFRNMLIYLNYLLLFKDEYDVDV